MVDLRYGFESRAKVTDMVAKHVCHLVLMDAKPLEIDVGRGVSFEEMTKTGMRNIGFFRECSLIIVKANHIYRRGLIPEIGQDLGSIMIDPGDIIFVGFVQ